MYYEKLNVSDYAKYISETYTHNVMFTYNYISKLYHSGLFNISNIKFYNYIDNEFVNFIGNEQIHMIKYLSNNRTYSIYYIEDDYYYIFIEKKLYNKYNMQMLCVVDQIYKCDQIDGVIKLFSDILIKI